MPEEDIYNILITGLRDMADRLDRVRSSNAPQNQRRPERPVVDDETALAHNEIRRQLKLVFEQHGDNLNDFERGFCRDVPKHEGGMTEKQLHCAGKILSNYAVDTDDREHAFDRSAVGQDQSGVPCDLRGEPTDDDITF